MASGPAPAPLPAYFEWKALPSWRAIDFISDLHLCAAMPLTFAAWAHHLLHTPADAVVMLGDLFEVWVGDDMSTLPFEQRCRDVMAEAASHRQLAFMAGNRDFLVGASMLRDSGLTGLPDPTVLSAWGHDVLLSHGDALCLSDVPYQRFRAQVRGTKWQTEFLARPLADRVELAAQMRRASAQRHELDGAADVDIDPATAVQWMHASGVSELVHGHTHRPGSGMLAHGYKRHVLSDWDLDHARRAEVLRLDRNGFSRLPPTRAASSRQPV